MKITQVCIEKPVFAWMIMLATVVFGGVAATRIGISQFPDVDFPTINVSAVWEGAAPEVIEHDVVEPIEEAVMQVEGVRSVTSSSRQGSGSVTIELDLARNVDLALQDVQTRVAQVQRRLPRDLEPPVVSKTNPEDQPIMWIGLSGPYSPQMLADYARYRVKEKLQTVPGVGEIQVGSVERNIRIWLDSDKLDERRVTVSEVLGAIGQQHVELPAGRLETSGREVNVRVLGEAFNLEEFRRLVVKNVEGAPVYLSDVAIVEDGFEDIRRISRVNGEPAQGMGVRKQRGSNAVAVARGVKESIAEIQKTLPPGMQLGINFDSTQFIEESVHEIQFELMLSVILTAVICWLFLGSLGATLNVILAIPMSLLGTVACIYFFGFTLNTFTLLGLALAVGIVVDDAIMVLENIFRHAEMGKDRRRAASEGTDEISFAALAATLAVCAIFLPVVFMKGIIGKFFLQFGVTLCVAVLLSYVEAITLAPARSAQMLNAGAERQSKLGHFVDKAFDKLAAAYGRVLAMGLKRPVAVLIAALLVFAASLYVFKKLPSEFVPSQDQSRLMIRLQTAVGSDITETDRVFQRAEQYLLQQKEVVRVFGSVGGFGGGGGSVNSGILFVTMIPPDERVSQQEFATRIRKELNSYPGVRAVVQDLSQQGFTAQRGFPIEFSVRGPEWEKLTELSNDMREKLAASGFATDVDTDYQVGMPELRIVPDRDRAADLGVPVEQVATSINALVGGVRTGKYSSGGRRIDVRTRLLAKQRTRPEDLSRLRVRTASGDLIPMSALVKEEERPALQSVTRRDRERAISIYGNVAPGKSQNEALAFVEQISKDLPPGYRAVLGGSSVAFRESMGQLMFALVLGVIVAYMVLASQFNSFLHPVTVLSILPLSIAGAAFALLVTGKTLNIFSMIGLLLLMGIAKKNSIILVDYAVQKQGEGATAHEAMLKAGPVRLRPILMTSLATMMAAIPPALALGPGAETRGPMAVAIIGGLVISTALSLLVVPAFFVVADRIKTRLGEVFARRHEDEPEEATAHG
ncbi:MAG TPA: efflux RND transporter permease subunit [Thermoanaerobaculia bacterium]|nr:efflux RND transporter permease subunit [Thermoanaerobaculia bacterium]